MRRNNRTFPVMTPLEPSVVSQKQLRTGMSYSMNYGGRKQEVAGIYPVPRASLAQDVLIHRYQNSHYVSVTGFPERRSFLIGYPQAHVLTMVGGGPSPNQTPAMANPVQSINKVPIQRGGTMAPSPRFKKALPLPLNNYTPPTYS